MKFRTTFIRDYQRNDEQRNFPATSTTLSDKGVRYKEMRERLNTNNDSNRNEMRAFMLWKETIYAEKVFICTEKVFIYAKKTTLCPEHLFLGAEHLFLCLERQLLRSEHCLFGTERYLLGSEHLLLRTEHCLFGTEDNWNTTGSADGRWAETFSYDANGNITKLKRRGNKVDTLAMDSLDYYYTSNTNQLDYVDDYVPAGNYSNDIDDQASNNYDYDAIGNLIKDTKEEIHDINWTVYGKIQNIIRITDSEKPNLSFGYTPDGHRSIKSVITDSTWGANRSIYVHDAQGNIMAVYAMPTIKLLDTTGLDFEAINNQLLDQIGNTAFGEFVVDDLDIVALMAANGNYDVPGDYRTAIYTISGATEEAMLLTLDPTNFFAGQSGLIGNILTNDYTSVEVLDVLLEGKTQLQVLQDVVGVKYNDVAFHTYLMGMFGNSWLTALYDYNATDFETFYIAAMTNNAQIPSPGQSYAFMENELTTLLSSIQLETELAGQLTSSYVSSAFYAYFSSVDVNQMLTSYTSLKLLFLVFIQRPI
jgi:hypothetical protein